MSVRWILSTLPLARSWTNAFFELSISKRQRRHLRLKQSGARDGHQDLDTLTQNRFQSIMNKHVNFDMLIARKTVGTAETARLQVDQVDHTSRRGLEVSCTKQCVHVF
jgi:hypothetical protein